MRPEKLELADGRTPDDGRNRVEGVLEVVTFLGPIVRLEVAVRGRPFWVDLPAGRAVSLARKDAVTLVWAPGDAVVIAASGTSPE